MNNIKHLEASEHTAWINYQHARTEHAAVIGKIHDLHAAWSEALLNLNTAKALSLLGLPAVGGAK